MGDMEYRMDRVHGVGESEHEGVGACLHDDCIWPKVLLRELLQGLCRVEVLSLDEYLVTNLEVRCQSPSGIHGSLVSLLGMGHLLMEELM